jgi:preprotein translocase subunit SecB
MQLDDYVFPEITISANKAFDVEKEFNFDCIKLKINPQVSVNNAEDFLLQLDVWSEASDEDNFPYDFHLSGVIKFSYYKIEDDVERQKRAFHNGASMLYAAIREQVVNLTSRNVYAPLFLPAWYFKPEDFVNSTESEEQKDKNAD